jgi:hypothetical protein
VRSPHDDQPLLRAGADADPEATATAQKLVAAGLGVLVNGYFILNQARRRERLYVAQGGVRV